MTEMRGELGTREAVELFGAGMLARDRGDMTAAREMLARAAAGGNAHANYVLGLDHELAGELDKAVALYELSAAHGCVWAMTNLASVLSREGDEAAGLAWVDRAA